MADFSAVLRKTLEGLGDTTPAMRERVYEKARSTIAAKLAALNPPPPAAVAERQRQALEDAIASVERSFTTPTPGGDPLDELDNVFSSINAQRQTPPPPKREPPAAPVSARAPEMAKPVQPAPTSAPMPPQAPPAASAPPRVTPQQAPAARATTTSPPAVPPPPAARSLPPEPRLGFEPESFDEEPDLDRFAAQDAPVLHEPGHWSEPKARRRRGAGGLVAAVLALLVLGGGAYAVWRNGAEFQRLTGISLPGQAGETTATEPAETTASAPAEEGETDVSEESEASASASADPDDAAAAQPAPEPAAAAAPKLTQRLDASGSETDPGAAPGATPGQSAVGEGTSVAQLTPPAAEGGDAQPTAPAPGAPAQAATPAPAASSVAVGQRAIFYEERTSASPGSAETGSIVWSTVQESPGGDLPPETAIRAEATIPGKDMQLRMTIRRNADRTLPASHIIEMIFLAPNAAGPEAIDNVLRVSMKGTEQDPGTPLLGNSAKIADGYFLVALDDGKGQAAANLALLKQQDWIDVPVVYKSGRRALFTMEKGIPGEKVFNDAMTAWQQNTNG